MTNQERIARLHARGWTDTAIGRELGRDHSFIRQVRLGKKPGSTLTGGLRTLERRRTVPPARARAGQATPRRPVAMPAKPAHVREPVLKFPSGLTLVDVRSPRAVTLRRQLAAAAARGQKVVITATFRKVKGYGGSGRFSSTTADPTKAGPGPKEERGEVRMGARRGGLEPADVLARMDTDGPGAALRALALEEPGIESVAGLGRIRVTIMGESD